MALLFISPLAAGDKNGTDVQLRDETYLERADEAMAHLYSLDYEKSLQGFRSLADAFPHHPGPPMNLAVVLWQQEMFRRGDLKLDRFLTVSHFTKETEAEMPQEQRQAFLQNLQRSKELANSYLERNPGDQDALFFLGSAYGIEASFEITIDHDKMGALEKGKKAFELHKSIIEENPEYYSAYLTVGMYEYVTDNLPWYVKWLAVLAGYSGDEDRGFEYLQKTAEHATFTSENARILLMVLYVREERYEKALEVAKRLHESFPRNPLFHVNIAQIHELREDYRRSAETFEQVLEALERERPNYQALPPGEVHFQFGRQLFRVGEYSQAKGPLQEALRLGSSDKSRALAHLRLGNIQDLQGNRELARAEYRKVLEFEDFEDSHDRARDYLDEPFRG